MATGDVLMFHSHAVHQGRDNTSADRIRLAGSFRYQPISQPVDEGALMPQHHYAEREVLYANWAYANWAYADWPYADPLKYYW
jgi:ectoine hydroxylase-related dioxygenase (phytanoyl-CoA dioxygenase family)